MHDWLKFYFDMQDGHPQELRPPLTLKWRKGKDMPVEMGIIVKSVVIGNNVYVGGGYAGKSHDDCTVMKLDLQKDEWTQLPQYCSRGFAMTSHMNQLVLVGGYDLRMLQRTNQIGVYVNGKWTNPYQPMNIARSHSTAVCFKNSIIIAGGWNDKGHISSVEVLDITSRRWHMAESLPSPQINIKSTLIASTLYLMGGLDYNGYTRVVHKVDLNELIAKAISQKATSTLWQDIESSPLYLSAPLSVRGSLLAVGGRVDRYNSSSSINLYQPDINQWVEVGNLPTVRYGCTCSVLPSGEIIVAGGHDQSELAYINAVDFFCITDDH